MLTNFSCINLCTEYSVSGAMTKSHAHHPCFRNAFVFNKEQAKDRKYINNYHIDIYHTNDRNISGYNNYCISDINKYLRYLSSIIHFEYSIDIKNTHCVVTITVNDYRYIHNFILCCVRYLYEFPYNLAINDAIKIYESGEFPGLNILDCFNLVLASSNASYSGEQVCLYHHEACKPLSGKEIRNILYSYEKNNNTCFKIGIKYDSDVILWSKKDHIENFINKFYKRIPTYRTNYEKIKKYV